MRPLLDQILLLKVLACGVDINAVLQVLEDEAKVLRFMRRIITPRVGHFFWLVCLAIYCIKEPHGLIGASHCFSKVSIEFKRGGLGVSLERDGEAGVEDY